jgi:hypothetical protein
MENEDLAMKRVQLLALVALLASAALIGCIQTKSEVEVKPVDINLNITGQLELVITDARQQEERLPEQSRSARCGLKTLVWRRY